MLSGQMCLCLPYVQTQPAKPAVDTKQVKKEQRVVLTCVLIFLALLLIAGMVYAAITVEKENAAIDNRIGDVRDE